RRAELEPVGAHAPLPGAPDGGDVGARDPQWRMRLLERLGDHVAGGKVEETAVELDRVLGEALHHDLHRLFPHVALVAHPSAEGMQLDGPLPFAQAELDAPAREEIEGGHPLRDADGMIRGELDDPVTEADLLRALAGRPEEDLGRRRVRVLLEEVMLHFPRVVVAQSIRELDLRQRLLKEPVLAVGAPRPGQLVLVEDPKLHGLVSLSSRAPSVKGGALAARARAVYPRRAMSEIAEAP